MANTFVAVEGHHDLEFVCGLLKALGFKKVTKEAELDSVFGKRLITKSFPYLGDIHMRVPNPMFLQREDDWVAVRAAGGETPDLLGIVQNVLNSLSPFPNSVDAIGVFRDADELSAVDRFTTFCGEFEDVRAIDGYTINFPEMVGQVANGTPQFGVFVIPDSDFVAQNNEVGTLEDLLLECADKVYPGLLGGAQQFVESVDVALLDKKDKRLFEKRSGRKKAVVACTANILKPGMTIATSIDQNRWLCSDTHALPRVAAMTEFLKQLVGFE